MTAPPPRTLSAPHGKSQVARHLDPKLPFRAAGAAGAPLVGAFANRVPPATSDSSSPIAEAGPTAGGEQTASTGSPAGSPNQQDAAPLPPPTSMIEEDEFKDDDPDHPEEGIFGTGFMMQIRNQLRGPDCLVDEVRDLANGIWERVPESDRAAQPTSAWSREGMFSEKQPTRAKERTLHNHILGILTRLTPENYNHMERELLDLPIRQSTKEQIEDLVRTIYMKAIRPEDAPYVELYMKLVVALVNHCGTTGHGVGKTICRAIVENCQQQFEGSKFVLKPEDTVSADGTPLLTVEIDEKKKMLKDRLKANITFLGHLFIHHLVQEKVVNLVLYQLMYGDQSRPRKGRHKPEDYEVEMFCELFKKVGPHLTQKTLEGEHWPTYLDSMKTLSTTTSSMRIKFMLMDTLEMFHNGWKSRKSFQGPMKLDEQMKKAENDKMKAMQDIEQGLRDKSMGRIQRAPGSHSMNLPKVPEPVKLPPKNEIIEHLKDFISYRSDEGFETLKAFLAKLPTHTDRKNFFSYWMERTLTTVRCSQEREVLGELLIRLEKSGIFKERDLFDIIDQRLLAVATEGTIEDNPKLISLWAGVISKASTETGAAHPFLGMNMHSVFLRHLVDQQRPVEEIVKFITTVWEDSGSRIFECQPKTGKRFRLLPYVLRYTLDEDEEAAMLEAQMAAAEDDQEVNADIPMDLLDKLATIDSEAQVEVKVFEMLSNGNPPQDFNVMLNRHPQRAEIGLATAVVSAIFIFVRFDVSRLDGLREVFSSLVRSHRDKNSELGVAVLSEIYATWKELDCCPENSFGQMAQWLVNQRFIQGKAMDEFKTLVPPDVVRKLEAKYPEK